MVSSSTGGKFCWKTPTGPTRRNSATRAASSTSGASPLNQSGEPPWRIFADSRFPALTEVGSGSTGNSSLDMRRLHQKHAAPSQLSEFALMGVEHERPGVIVRELKHGPLSLAESDDIGPFVAGQVGAGAVQSKEVAVNVERVQQIELGHIHHVRPYQLSLADPNRVLLVVKGHRIDGVDLILLIEVRIEPIHHHHQLAGCGAAGLRIYDEGTVQALMDVALDGHCMAVVQVQAKGLRVEFVDVAPTGAYRFECPIHVRWMHAMEVDAVSMTAAVGKPHPDPVPLGAADRRPGNLTVIGPCRVEHPGSNLYLAIFGNKLVLAHGLAGRKP